MFHSTLHTRQSSTQEHMLLHTRQSSTQNNKFQVSRKYSCFSWWYAHHRPKHVEERNKHTKKNCAPSWLCLQAVVSISKQQNHLCNAIDHIWRWLNVNRPKHVVCQQNESYFDTNSLTNQDLDQQLPLPCCFLDSSVAVNQDRKCPPALKILSLSFCYCHSVPLIHEYF